MREPTHVALANSSFGLGFNRRSRELPARRTRVVATRDPHKTRESRLADCDLKFADFVVSCVFPPHRKRHKQSRIESHCACALWIVRYAYCNTLQHGACRVVCFFPPPTEKDTIAQWVTLCARTLQHVATHCNTRQHTATYCALRNVTRCVICVSLCACESYHRVTWCASHRAWCVCSSYHLTNTSMWLDAHTHIIRRTLQWLTHSYPQTNMPNTLISSE